jgi:three-Cys-motif partner protein
MPIPPHYHGREQSYLKHRVLHDYLVQWGHKLAGNARFRRGMRLWYVDTFAGPWNERTEDLRDTSIAIALEALEMAAATWRERRFDVELRAIFVEKSPTAFKKLKSFLDPRSGPTISKPLQGEFRSHVPEIVQALGTDPAFIFIDPKGWKDAAMRDIAPLTLVSAPRDVLVNVMFDHLNRQKDRPIDYIRQQMQGFFGLTTSDLPEGLSEDELLELYREQLKERCGLAYAADLIIPDPLMARTKFRLVVGGKHPAVLQVFRDVERKICRGEAAEVRRDAKRRAKEERTKQLAFAEIADKADSFFDDLHESNCEAAKAFAVDQLREHREIYYRDLWPQILERWHLTKTETRSLVATLVKRGDILSRNSDPSDQSVNDESLLAAATPTTHP